MWGSFFSVKHYGQPQAKSSVNKNEQINGCFVFFNINLNPIKSNQDETGHAWDNYCNKHGHGENLCQISGKATNFNRMKKNTLILCFLSMFFCFFLSMDFQKESARSKPKKVGHNFLYEKTMRFSTPQDFNAIVLSEAYVHHPEQLKLISMLLTRKTEALSLFLLRIKLSQLSGMLSKEVSQQSLISTQIMAVFLQTYVDQINFAISNNIEARHEATEEWVALLSTDFFI